MKVNYGDGNDNEAFLGQFPEADGYPHFYVLDSGGNLIKSQGTGELEEGKGYNEGVFLAFLEKFKPKMEQ